MCQYIYVYARVFALWHVSLALVILMIILSLECIYVYLCFTIYICPLIHRIYVYAVSGEEGGLQRRVPDLRPGLHPRLTTGLPAQAAAWVC